jgi:hypothetical protein
MKNVYLCLLLFAFNANAQAQTENVTKESAADLEDSGVKVNRNVIKFGLSLGFNYLTSTLTDATLSPADNSLKLQTVNPLSFLLSTSVVINPITGYYRKLENGEPVGEVYSVPSRLSFVATVNLAQFGASEATAFNKKIDGGLGLGVRLNDDFHVALTAEMISARELRDYVVQDYNNQPIIVNNETLNALDVKDDRLFVDNYYFGLSVKFIYILIGQNKEVD